MNMTTKSRTSSPLCHLLHACTALTLLAAPTIAQLDCAAAAQGELARLVDQGTAAAGCDTASPAQICAASGHPGPCALQADCTGISTQNVCPDPPAGTYGPYGGDADEAECCVVFYTHACGAAEPPGPEMQGGGRRLAEGVREGGTDLEGGCDSEAVASVSAVMCLPSCGGSDADSGAADGGPVEDVPDPEADDVEGPVVIGFARKGGRGGGFSGGGRGGGGRGRSTFGPAFVSHGANSGAGQQGAAVGAVFAGVVAALAAAL